MGVDTRLYISHRWNVKDICDVISIRFNVETRIKFNEWAPDYMTVHFQLPDSECERMLHVHTDSKIGGFKAILMSFRSNPEGHKILKTLAKTFGDMFQEADIDDTFEEFQEPSHGNVDFVVNECLKSNPKLGGEAKAMASFISEDGWKQNLDKINKVKK